MTKEAPWKDALKLFFTERAKSVDGVPTVEDLCYVSGREPRIWTQPEIYADMVEDILFRSGAGPDATVLEVGCASGFIARGVAPRVSQYTGIDVSKSALRVAQRLHLQNASFRRADGKQNPFPDASFDAAFCYDVFTNFPTFEEGAAIIREMLRVVKPGRKALLGSIPDASKKDAYERRVKGFVADLDVKFGQLRPRVARRTFMSSVTAWISRVQPDVQCYYFRIEDFRELGELLGARTECFDIHALNPYAGYRFNVVYTKPGA